jgi:uncharacterized membrane protein YvbJ
MANGTATVEMVRTKPEFNVFSRTETNELELCGWLRKSTSAKGNEYLYLKLKDGKEYYIFPNVKRDVEPAQAPVVAPAPAKPVRRNQKLQL